MSPFLKGGRKLKGFTTNLVVLSLLLSISLSPLVPIMQALAQETSSSISSPSETSEDPSIPSGVASTTSTDSTSPDSNVPEDSDEEVVAQPEEIPRSNLTSSSTPVQHEQNEESDSESVQSPIVEVVATSTATTTEVLVATSTPKRKFKKDNSLSHEEQLAAVRQHLINNNLPTALERLGVFELQQKEVSKEKGMFKKVFDFITGNSDEAKAKREAVEFGKREPFKVETFEGKINTADVSRFEKDFSKSREQSGLIQKVKNLIESGTFFNSDFDRTKPKENIISHLLGGIKVFANASDNPSDYLSAGGEITFSQAIQDKADALENDPLALLNFVRNDVEYVPYYGSKKGADATLIELAGNDMDKASLLIAMLRHSEIPARYRHVDIKAEIETINNLLGVDSATSSAQILSLEKIPYTLYTIGGEPAFFVIEHTFIEAYIPYGYTRGVDLTDGGDSQWVPMDPTINSYFYGQEIDVLNEMNEDGFVIEDFFEDYLEGDYGSLEPLAAFKSEVEDHLASGTPTFAYEEVLAKRIYNSTPLEFIPGSLPYEISADLNTYDYVPTSLRHTINFTVTNNNDVSVLTHAAYLSDVADKELLVTYVAATSADQTIINSFSTIYDVVPLSLVAVKPTIKVNGSAIATASATSTLGYSHSYEMEFNIPIRTIGNPVSSLVTKTYDKSIITGNTDAIALNTDRVVPTELRPAEDTDSDSYVADQVLYRTALDYLDGNQYTQRELADVMGGDFTHTVTKASVNNGIEVTYSGGAPYSFDWIGLRIDAFSQVRYFSKIYEPITTHRKEFMAVFGLQASQDESDVFEENFNVESIATVKGLKLVNDNEFSGVKMEKFTSANENDIDLLSVSTSTKTVFHTAVDEGRTVYTPSESVTYGEWEGLFYITIDFDGGDASYAIGEGLNGGYSACAMPGVGGSLCNWTQGTINLILPKAQASGVTATITASPLSVVVGQTVNVVVEYAKGAVTWVKNLFFKPKVTGTMPINTGHGSGQTTNVTVTPATPGFPAATNPSQSTFESEMGTRIMKAIAWQEYAAILCKTTKEHYAHYCNHADFNTSFNVIKNSSDDWGVMQINRGVWKNYLSEPKNNAGDHDGWDWTARDWKENIYDAKHIVNVMLQKVNTKQSALGLSLSEETKGYYAAYGYHSGEGDMRTLMTTHGSSLSGLNAHYYTGDGLSGHKNGVIRFYTDEPWN